MAERYIVFTDGGCEGNPGPGGFGAVIARADHPSVEAEDIPPHEWVPVSGGHRQTTNNRMELIAAAAVLEWLPEGSRVELHTDSKYVRDGITQWVRGWKRNGWRTASKQPVKNVELWKRLDRASAQHQVEWRWVKGHAGQEQNERADVLAGRAITDVKRGTIAPVDLSEHPALPAVLEDLPASLLPAGGLPRSRGSATRGAKTTSTTAGDPAGHRDPPTSKTQGATEKKAARASGPTMFDDVEAEPRTDRRALGRGQAAEVDGAGRGSGSTSGARLKLVLASTSRYRRAQLERLGLSFDTVDPGVDEGPIQRKRSLTPAQKATALAVAKAEAAAAGVDGPALIVGGDQLVVLDGKILGKPGTLAKAATQLLALAGKTHELLTALAVLDTRTGRTLTHLDTHRMSIRALDRPQARAYVARDQTADCAGAYKIESLGIALFDAIDGGEGGDPSAIEGLPLIALCRILRDHGLDPIGTP